MVLFGNVPGSDVFFHRNLVNFRWCCIKRLGWNSRSLGHWNNNLYQHYYCNNKKYYKKLKKIFLKNFYLKLVNLKLALNTQFWNGLMWIAFFFTSIGAYFAYIWIGSSFPSMNVYLTANIIFSSSLFYFTVFLSIFSMFMFDALFSSLKFS
jgi:hypothetical protein